MSKLADRLREHGIFNAWGFAGHGNPYICYTPTDYGRGGQTAHFSVVRPGFQTDTNAHWQDYGCKTINAYGKERKRQAFEEIKKWASKQYGIKEWARTPFGSWMDAGFVKRRLAELKLNRLRA